MLDIKQISKSYGSLNALIDINLSISEGEVVGLLGVNGAGKSTLLKILSTVLSPDGGVVSYNGKDHLNDLNQYKRQIGYLSEDNPLYEDMYVIEYLNHIADIYKENRLRVYNLISQLGLSKEIGKKIKTLSKGNKQRVGIAQTLLHNPQVLILDEVTSGLDLLQRESLLNLLSDLSEERIILFSTHIMQDVKALCTRVVLIHHGAIMADEKIDKIESIENLFHQLTDENNRR